MINRFFRGAAQGLNQSASQLPGLVAQDIARREQMLEQRRIDALNTQRRIEDMKIAQQERERKEQIDNQRYAEKMQFEQRKLDDLNQYRNNSLNQRIQHQEQQRLAKLPPREPTREEYAEAAEKAAETFAGGSFNRNGKEEPKGKSLNEIGRIFDVIGKEGTKHYNESEIFEKQKKTNRGLINNFGATIGYKKTPTEKYQERVPAELRSLYDKKKGVLTQDFYQSTNFLNISKSPIGRKAIADVTGIKDLGEQDEYIEYLQSEVVPHVQSFGTGLVEILNKKYPGSRAASAVKQFKNEITGTHLTNQNPKEALKKLLLTYADLQGIFHPEQTENSEKQTNISNQQQSLPQLESNIEQDENGEQFNRQLRSFIQPDKEEFPEEEGGDLPIENSEGQSVSPEREREIDEEIKNSEIISEERTISQIFSQKPKEEKKKLVDENLKNVLIKHYGNLPEFQNLNEEGIEELNPVAKQIIKPIGDLAQDLLETFADNPELHEKIFGDTPKQERFTEEYPVISAILRAPAEIGLYEGGLELIGKATKIAKVGEKFGVNLGILERILNGTIYGAARGALSNKENRSEGALRGGAEDLVAESFFGSLGHAFKGILEAPIKKGKEIAKDLGVKLEEKTAKQELDLINKKEQQASVNKIDEIKKAESEKKQLEEEIKSHKEKDRESELKSELEKKHKINFEKDFDEEIARDFKREGLSHSEKAEKAYSNVEKRLEEKIPFSIKKIIGAEIRDKKDDIIKLAVKEGETRADINSFIHKIEKADTYQDLKNFIHGANKLFSENKKGVYDRILKEFKPIIEKQLDKVTSGEFGNAQKNYSNFQTILEKIGIDKRTIDAFQRGDLSKKKLLENVSHLHAPEIEKLVTNPNTQEFKFLGEKGLNNLIDKKLEESISKPKSAIENFDKFSNDIKLRLKEYPELQKKLEGIKKDLKSHKLENEQHESFLNKKLDEINARTAQNEFEKKLSKESPEKIAAIKKEMESAIKNIEHDLSDPRRIEKFVKDLTSNPDTLKSYAAFLAKVASYWFIPVIGKLGYPFEVGKILYNKLSKDIAIGDIKGVESTTEKMLKNIKSQLQNIKKGGVGITNSKLHSNLSDIEDEYEKYENK